MKFFSAEHAKKNYPTHYKKNLGGSHDVIPSIAPVAARDRQRLMLD
jgi:hypothetical protein